MKYKLAWIIYWLNNVYLSFQYSPPTYRKVHTNPCDGNKASLVEHFFTLIFSEFRNPPPLCVCVQMCSNQATYCYPNGCLKKSPYDEKVAEKRRQEIKQVLRVQNKKPMFLVDNSGSQVTKFNEEFPDTIHSGPMEPHFSNNLHNHAFDKYKTIYKHRKLSKIQLQYNLREQVKNTKSNIHTDVASSRWPLNKMRQVTIGKTYHPSTEIMMVDRSAKRSKYFKPLNVPSLVTRFSKRDLKPSDNNAYNENSDVIETIQNVENHEKFSLEKLINDLIESSIDSNNNKTVNDTDSSSKKNNDDVKANLVTSIADNDKILPISTESLDTSNEIIYETTTITLLNETNDLLNDTNFEYEDDSLLSSQTPKEMFQNIYNDDSIESLSKRIDKLNNTSFELMNDHIEAIKGDSRNTSEITWVLSANNTSEREDRQINEDNSSKNSTSLLNN